MPPKPTHPRLADVDGRMIAVKAGNIIREQADRLDRNLGAVMSSIKLLTDYARTGVKPTNWSCGDGIVEVALALYTRAVDRGTFGGLGFDLPDDLDADDEIGVVLLAANARQSIALGQPVKSKELAALANLNYQRIRELIRAGELPELKAGNVSALQAKRFLAARKVAGFGEAGQ